MVHRLSNLPSDPATSPADANAQSRSASEVGGLFHPLHLNTDPVVARSTHRSGREGRARTDARAIQLPVELHIKIARCLTDQPPYETSQSLQAYRLSSRIGNTAMQDRSLRQIQAFTQQVGQHVAQIWPTSQTPLSLVQLQTYLSLLDFVSPRKRANLTLRALEMIRQDPSGRHADTVTTLSVLTSKLSLIPGEQHAAVLSQILQLGNADRPSALKDFASRFADLSPQARENLVQAIDDLPAYETTGILQAMAPHMDALPQADREQIIENALNTADYTNSVANAGALLNAAPHLSPDRVQHLVNILLQCTDEFALMEGLVTGASALKHLPPTQRAALAERCLDIDNEWNFSSAAKAISGSFAHLSQAQRHEIASEMLGLEASGPRCESVQALADQITTLDPSMRTRCVDTAVLFADADNRSLGLAALARQAQHLSPAQCNTVFQAMQATPVEAHHSLIFEGFSASWPALDAQQQQNMLDSLQDHPKASSINALRHARGGLSHHHEARLAAIARAPAYSLSPARTHEDRARQTSLALHDLMTFNLEPKALLQSQAQLLVALADHMGQTRPA